MDIKMIGSQKRKHFKETDSTILITFYERLGVLKVVEDASGGHGLTYSGSVDWPVIPRWGKSLDYESFLPINDIIGKWWF